MMNTENPSRQRELLPLNYQLHWYEIRAVLGQGGYGVTYLAYDKNLDQYVAIKEYSPLHWEEDSDTETAEYDAEFQSGVQRFLKEAKTLAKFRHPNIVRVLSVFEQDQTAYMVMEYEQGKDLDEYYRQHTLTETQLLEIFLPILDGLKLVHDANFIHRDVKPSNIFIRANGTPVLIDFGAARKTRGQRAVSMTRFVTDGFTPVEQYDEDDTHQGPWTDIYALGASLYLAITGNLPESAVIRGQGLVEEGVDPYIPAAQAAPRGFSRHFLQAIDKALQFDYRDRPQNLYQWVNLLGGGKAAVQLSTATPNRTSPSAGTDGKISNPAYTIHPNAQAVKPPVKPRTKPGHRLRHAIAAFLPSRYRKHRMLATALLMVILIIGLSIGIWTPGHDNTAPLLQRAKTAVTANHLFTPRRNNAYDLVQQILAQKPQHTEALDLQQQIVSRYLHDIKDDLARQDYAAAQLKLNLLTSYDIQSPAIEQFRQQLATTLRDRNTIHKLLQQAQSLLFSGHLTQPDHDNALAKFRQVLQLSPQHKDAVNGIRQIFERLQIQAQDAIHDDHHAQAAEYIAVLESIHPDSQAVEALKSELQQAQRIRALLQKAKLAFSQNHWFQPRGDNALYYYQQVLQLEPEQQQATGGINRVFNTINQQFRKNLNLSRINAAYALLQVVAKHRPGSALLKSMQASYKKATITSPMEKVNEIVSQFRSAFENRNTAMLRLLSGDWQNRSLFVSEFFHEYSAFKLQILKVNYRQKEQQGVVKIKIINLVNREGQSVETSADWSQFTITIEKKTGTWLVYW